ncbi:ORF6N domain-containing protein [Anaerotignum sp. MB30-C6]|uniref:ORF6N domain-containing protein n=1 Tax=Anaerotignum sp. MB30-C6 TaxID=3070814 RepID=UPI0027DB5EEA|nr:ORF6N domain-containing protein [Anaerotignum sp. MB30-C6]WMI80949.1 ORF6N domain-containing protein [Anaerotignum sp. MB30-C6]
MKQLTVNGTQNFMGKSIPVVSGGFGQGKKCMSDKTIAEIHGVTTSDIRKAIGRNANRFKSMIDFVDLNSSSCGDGLFEQLGYSKQQIIQAEHIYILSERGYSKLIKIMDTDLAWEIHDKLMDEYFEMRDTVIPKFANDLEYAKVQAQKARADAMLLNAKNRTFKTLMDSISNKNLSPIAVQVFGLKSLESTFGISVGEYLPECEKTYSATEIGEMLGISANKVGKIANANNLKTEEYGVTVMDKSRYSSKEVPNFRYFAKAIDVIREIMGSEVC